MKRSFYLQIILALLLWVSRAQAQWEMHRLPGGSTFETVIVNEPNVKGMWVIEKQAGAYWVQWNTTANNWDPLNDASEYDACYPWFMGGDERSIGGTPYTIVATYQGTHRYAWDGDSWEPYPDAATSKAPNDYYRWHDAAFVADVAGSYSPDHFIVCSVPEWSPLLVSYHKGLYLIVGGSAPAGNTYPITGTDGHFYSYLYRDMDAGCYQYTWYHDEDFGAGTEECDFQKVTISGLGAAITAAVASDFDEQTLHATLKNVHAFYQYADGSVRHQFILANSITGGVASIDVWHREHSGGGFSSTGWAKICQNLGNRTEIQDYNGGSLGLVAYYESSYYIIYLVAGGYGLVHIKVPVTQPDRPTITPFSQDAADRSYLRKWGDRSLNLNPWWRASHPNQDQLIIGSPHADLHLATINLAANPPTVLSYKNIEDVDWSGYKTNGTSYKGGPFIWSYVARNATEAYFIHDGTGIFRAITDPWIHYDKMGTGGTHIQSKADFNFSFRSGVISPFHTDYILVGSAGGGFYWQGARPPVNHGGIWKLDLTSSSAEMQTTDLANEANHIQSMAAASNRLYYACREAREDSWWEEEWNLTDDVSASYLRTSAGSSYRNIADTGPRSLNQSRFVQYWVYPNGQVLCAAFRVLKPHPANGVTGVVYGLVCPFWDIDWGEAPTESGGVNPDNGYIGGGLGYLYYDGANWVPVEILDIDHHGITNATWFENVQCMVVEMNSSYTPEHLNVDVLAACGAYQISRKGEDYPRYGGLFKAYYNDQSTSWVVNDVTPSTNDYQLAQGIPLTNPAVTWVDSVVVNGLRYYFCTTMGDKIASDDEPLCLLWYQQADNIRAISSAWTKWNTTGLVPYIQHGGSSSDAYWVGSAAESAGGYIVNLFLGGVVAAQLDLSP